MVRSLHAVRGSAHVGFCLRGRHEFLQGLIGAVGTHDHHGRFDQVVHDGNHLRGRKRSTGLRGQCRKGRQIDKADRLAVGLGVNELRPTDLTVGAREVVDDEGTTHILFGIQRQKAGARVRTGTGLVGHDDVHVTRGLPGSSNERKSHNSRCSERQEFLIHKGPPFGLKTFPEPFDPGKREKTISYCRRQSSFPTSP